MDGNGKRCAPDPDRHHGCRHERTHQARERGRVEAKLDNREAILQAVTDSAANLLNAQDLDGAITGTLAALGPALGVSRIYITPLTLTADRRVLINVSHEWFRPGMVPAKTLLPLAMPISPPHIRLKIDRSFLRKGGCLFPRRFSRPGQKTA